MKTFNKHVTDENKTFAVMNANFAIIKEHF
jgi:hypothetical protein